MRVLVVGDVVTDILAVHSGSLAVGSDTPADISLVGGGSAANTAAWLASRRIAVDLVAVVGLDDAGRDRTAELEAAGVGCDFVRRSDGARTGSVIVLAHAHERSMLCDRGANLLIGQSDVDLALPGASHVHLSGYTLLDVPSRPAGLHALARASALDITTSVDAASAAPLRQVGGPSFLDWVRGADLLFANLDEAHALVGDGPPAELARRLAGTVRHAVVKLGRAGAVYAGPHGVVEAPAVPAARVVDPTGAGDAFAAGFLASWLVDADPAAAVRSGAELGAKAVTLLGGRPQPPTPRPPTR